MKTWITSDLHLSHRNISKFCPTTRGHWDTRNDPDTMNRDMITIWNNKVSPEDTVYILGDVAFCGAQAAADMLNQMNGKKILVEGNHDQKNLRDSVFRDCFAEVHKYLEIEYAGHFVCMFHYPIQEWNKMHRGSLHFFGHLHGNVSGLEHFRARDVAFDATGNVVSLMEDMIADAMKGEIKAHH
jgi:calcineurin-like phosphoesterase family protein